MNKTLTLTEFLLACVYVTVSTLFLGFVFSKLWLWFIVPFGIPTISLAHAIGIMLITKLATLVKLPEHDFEEESIHELFFMGMSYYLITLTIGWFIQLFL